MNPVLHLWVNIGRIISRVSENCYILFVSSAKYHYSVSVSTQGGAMGLCDVERKNGSFFLDCMKVLVWCFKEVSESVVVWPGQSKRSRSEQRIGRSVVHRVL